MFETLEKENSFKKENIISLNHLKLGTGLLLTVEADCNFKTFLYLFF